MKKLVENKMEIKNYYYQLLPTPIVKIKILLLFKTCVTDNNYFISIFFSFSLAWTH